MNKTAYIAALTDHELADEIALYTEELREHLHHLEDWRGYDFYRLLMAEQQGRSERQERAVLLAA